LFELDRTLLMNNRKSIIYLFILSLACLGSQNTLAGIVYQWIDEAGNVNFSDVPPDESVVTELRNISINEHKPDNVDFEKYSIINQAKLMTEWRRQITEERLEKKRLRLEEKRLAYEMELNSQNQDVSYQAYVPYVYPYLPNRYRRHHGASILPYPTHNGKTVNVTSHRGNTKNKCC